MRILSAVFSLALTLALSGCGKSGDGPVNKQNSEGTASSGGDVDIVGAGASFLDGLIRIDGGYGLRSPGGFRLDLYLDAIL